MSVGGNATLGKKISEKNYVPALDPIIIVKRVVQHRLIGV
jgi:hypothetical protein